MTREELAEEIVFMLTEHRADGVLADHTADAVIRLVVKACCAELTAEVERMKARASNADDEAAKAAWSCYALEAATCKALLLQSFLPTPTTEPADG